MLSHIERLAGHGTPEQRREPAGFSLLLRKEAITGARTGSNPHLPQVAWERLIDWRGLPDDE
jgi:hypothetical protein